MSPREGYRRKGERLMGNVLRGESMGRQKGDRNRFRVTRVKKVE